MSQDEKPRMDRKVFRSLEELEMRRRWPRVRRQLGALVDHVKEIHLRANPERLPGALSELDRKRLLEGLFQAIVADKPQEVTRSVARRMANKIGDYLLWRREPTVPVIHELLALAPWWISNMPGDVFPALRDIGLTYVLNGQVMPVQQVWREILEARTVFLSHCTCRSSRISDDLRGNDREVYTIVSKRDNRRLLDRFLDRYRGLIRAHGSLPDTDPKFETLCRELEGYRASGSPRYSLETLLAATHPEWEILPVLEKYTPSWIRSLHANRKAHRIHRELAFEFATIHYLARGTVFSSMSLFDTPYCICTCPTPENGGGCVLTNWYYGGGSSASLLPNEAFHGRRRNRAGGIEPCNQFPIRGTRACIGCGCLHGSKAPRSTGSVLRQADRVLREHHDGT